MRSLILAFGLLAASPSFASKCESEILNNYSKTLNKYAHEANATSLVWFDSNDFCSLHSGNLNTISNATVNDESIYQIASLSKVFTGTLTSKLVAEESVDLAQSVYDLLGLNKENFENVSFRNVLHHQSGLPRDSTSVNRIDGDPLLAPLTKEKLIQELKSVSLNESTAYEYSNLGYATVALMLEQKTGKSYSELLAENVLKPLSLNQTSVNPPRQKSNLVTPYRKDDKEIPTGYWEAGYLAGASALYSSPRDVSKLTQALMNCQINDCHNYDIFSSSMPVTGNRAYGFGMNKDIITLRDYDYPIYYHSGDMDGFAGLIFISHVHEQGFIILTSRGGDWKDRFQSELIQIMLKQPFPE